MIAELLALIVSYSGIFVGKYLSKIAKEEVEDGRKNLAYLSWILRLSVIIIFLASNNISLSYKILALSLMILAEYIIKDNYSWLGILFGLNPDFLTSSLIFLYGFPKGSLMKGSYAKILKKTWIYLLLGLILLLLTNFP